MSSYRRFYFIRHGRTDANVQHMMCGGDWDIGINEEGVAQATAVAPRLVELVPPVSRLYVSPMLRAHQTATLINAQLQAPIETVEGLREWRVGEWEGKPWGDVPNPFEAAAEPPGGESRLQFEKRLGDTVLKILEKAEGVPLLVSHGAAAHALFTVLGVDPLLIDNCALFLVEAEGERWSLRQI